MDCPICKEEFKNKAYTKCSHNFCKDCIIQWRKIGNNSCPLCREELVIETTDNIKKMIEERDRLENALHDNKFIIFLKKADIFFQNVAALLT